jgi:hypothetical protein
MRVSTAELDLTSTGSDILESRSFTTSSVTFKKSPFSELSEGVRFFTVCSLVPIPVADAANMATSVHGIFIGFNFLVTL